MGRLFRHGRDVAVRRCPAKAAAVGQVAQRMNIAPSAVRWYDDHGLLPSERTSGNQRRFFADVLCRVAMFKAAQRVGLSIEEIREALSFLPPRQAPTSDDWERLAEHLRDAATRRISDLVTVLEELSPDRQASRERGTVG
jgi:MerR family transcriptional regulator, redox-sensitive transcriptional activator SoxR